MNLDYEREAERLREMARDSHRPSPAVASTITEVAQVYSVDPDAVLAGNGIQTGEVIFHLGHRGQRDVDSLLLIIQVGDVPTDDQAALLRQLLEHNAASDCSTNGTYGVLEGTDVVILQKRIDLSKTADAASEVVQAVNTHAAQRTLLRNMQVASAELVRELLASEEN